MQSTSLESIDQQDYCHLSIRDLLYPLPPNRVICRQDKKRERDLLNSLSGESIDGEAMGEAGNSGHCSGKCMLCY